MRRTDPVVIPSFIPALTAFAVAGLTAAWLWRRSSPRRAIQAACLGLFLVLAWWPPIAEQPVQPVDLFLATDPLVAVVGMLAGKVFFPLLLLALPAVVVAMTGRFFCSHICPLGTALDGCDRLARGRRLRLAIPPRLRHARYAVLAVCLGAALFGWDLLGWVDPLVLLNRLAMVVIVPLRGTAARPDAAVLYQGGVAWLSGSAILAGLVVGIGLLALIRPRFWCSYLCPLGAMLAVMGNGAFWRWRVTADSPRGAANLASRRAFLGGLASGAAFGVAGRRLRPASIDTRGSRLIRPPGAVPEDEFLSRCVRCTACMGACPTGTLQPDWHLAGVEGLWAPRQDLRHAECRPDCTACGDACPTGAIRALPAAERHWAKTGTAYVQRDRCLPWSLDRPCVECHKQCPFDAVVWREHSATGLPLPSVVAERCDGCGRCERACPVPGAAAIVVTAAGELRLSTGSFEQAAHARGLVFPPRASPPAS